jgi:hypothetical protein
MLTESACSHAPPPATRAEIESTIKSHEGSAAVVRFHTTRGTAIVTSDYSSTDSTVVVASILWDSKYYRPTEAKLYEQELKRLPKETALPLEIPFNEIKFVDTWAPRSVKNDMAVGGGIVVVALVAIYAVALYFFSKALGGLNEN